MFICLTNLYFEFYFPVFRPFLMHLKKTFFAEIYKSLRSQNEVKIASEFDELKTGGKLEIFFSFFLDIQNGFQIILKEEEKK